MAERIPIMPSSASTIRGQLYANIYLQLIDRVTQHDKETVELLLELGQAISNWPDFPALVSEIYNHALGKENNNGN